MSYRHLNTKPLNVSLSALLKRGAHLGVGVGAMAPMLALAAPGLPTGGQVVGGQATISNPGSNGVVVKQTSASAIINWQQFNIGKGQYVQFIQPSSSSVVLNRVVGGSASSIFGSLTGNGQVFLVNTNGVFFGRSATLDLQGFLASTLDISDGNFMSGHYVFDQPGASGAEIINQGKLRAHNGGYIILAGDYAENDGLISAQSGHVILASGAKTTLNLNGNQLVNFAVNTSTLASFAGVENTGKLIADGGTVIMTADVANLLKSTVVNNQGLIEAHAINKSGGTITLTATGGNISNSGTLDADATKTGQQGGTVVLKTDGLMDLTPTSKITALGDDARGGDIVFHAQDAKFGGKFTVGRGGTILLDPAIITINSGPQGTHSNTYGTSGTNGLDAKLNAGSNVLISAGSSILKGTATSITAAGTGGLTLKVGSNGKILLSGLTINIGGAFKASAAGTAAQESYSNITAAGVTFNGFGATITDHADIKATTGNINVNAHGVNFSLGSDKASAGSVKILLTGGAALLDKVSGKTGITVHDTKGTFSAASLVASNGFVSVTDSSGAMNLGGAKIIGKTNVVIIDKKGDIFGPGAQLSASNGNVAVLASDGSITLTNVKALGKVHLLVKAGGRLAASTISAGGGVSLSALGNLVLDSADITAHGNIIVKGKNIAMNGAGVTIKALGTGHSVNMSASGGTLSAGNISAGGNVTLKAPGHEVFDARKIKTTGGNLTVTGNSVFMIGTSYKASAGSVQMTASSGGMSVSKVVGKTGITLKDVKGNIRATGLISASNGNVGITASSGAISADSAIKALGAGHKVSLLATGGNIHAVGMISAASGVSEKALGHTVHDSSLVETTGGNIVIRAGAVTAGIVQASNGSVSLTANGGSLTVGPVTGKTGVALSAVGHTITADGKIAAAAGNIKITAAQLTGSSLSISAGGKLTLAASIGKASAGNSFGHNVTLKAGGDVFVERSIYAGANSFVASSTAAPVSVNITAGGKVVIGAPNTRVNIFAGGAVHITGNTGVFEPNTDAGGRMIAGVDSHASSANRNLTLTATNGSISIAAMNGTQKSIDGANDPHAHTWSLQAGHDVILNAQAGVTLKAGDAVISASTALAGASSGNKAQINKFDNVIIAAGHSIEISTVTGNVDISGGSDKVKLADGDQFLKVNALGRVLLSASQGSVDITASNGQVNLKAGKTVITGTGTFSGISASVNAAVQLNAANAVNINGRDGVNIHAGSFVLGSGSGHSGNVNAEGALNLVAKAQAAIFAHGVSITASSGDVDITGGHVDVQGGGTSQGNFNLTAHAAADIETNSGGIAITAGQNINIQGGSSNTFVLNGHGPGHMNGSAGVDLGASSSGAINLTATHGNVTVAGGKNQTVSSHGGSQTLNFDNGAASLITQGNLTVSAGEALDVHTANISSSINSISLTAHDGNLSAGNLDAVHNIALLDVAGRLTAGNISAGGAVNITAGQLTGSGSNASSAGLGGSVSLGSVQGKSVAITAERGNTGAPGSGQLADIHVGNVTATSGGITITATDQVGNSSHGGGRISAGTLQATKGNIGIVANGVGAGAGKIHIAGTVTTVSSGNVSLSASHTGSRNGGSVSVGGAIDAAGNVNVSAFHAAAGTIGGYITLQGVTGVKINLAATNSATWSGGNIHVQGNLHATGTTTGDGITVTAREVGYSSSQGGRITVTGNVTADHGDVTLTASNSNASASYAARINAGTVLGRHVTVTAWDGAGGGGSAITLGHVTATSGATISAANGGAVTLASGSSGSASAKALGGNLVIRGGSLTVSGGGGLWLVANHSIDVTANIHSVSSANLRTIGGDVTAAGISASGSINLKAGSAVIDHGTISAGGNVTIVAKNINTLGGAIIAGNSASLSASNGNLNVGGVSANKITLNAPNGDIGGDGTIVARNSNLTINANSGSINFGSATLKAEGAGHNVTLTDVGQGISAGAISAAGSVTITAVGQSVTDHGVVKAVNGGVTVTAKSINTTGGNITAGGNASLSASSGSLQVGGVSANQVHLHAAGNIGGNGTIVAKNANLTITASSGSINFGSATLKAEGAGHNVTLTDVGNNLTAGAISAAGSVAITATSHSVTDHGAITADTGNVIIKGKSVNTTSGTITAGGSKASLSASSGSLQLGGVSANQVHLHAAGNIGGNGTIVAKNANLTITANSGSINFGSATLKAEGSAEGAGHNVIITDIGNEITAGNISASGSVTLTAVGQVVVDQGTINAKGGNVTIKGRSINTNGGTITAGGSKASLSASSGSLQVGGVSADKVILKATGNIGGNGTIVAKTNNLTIMASSGSIDFGSATLKAEGAGHNVTLVDVGNNIQAGAISASGSVTITAAGQTVFGDGMIVAKGGNVSITGKNIDLHGGGASAHGSVQLNANASGSLDAGRVIAGNSINLTHTGGDIKLVEARSAKNVTISAGTHQVIFNANPSSAAEAGAFGSNVTLKAKNVNDTGSRAITLQADKTLTINALLGSSASNRMSGGVFLNAGNALTLAHGIFAKGSVGVSAPTLTFTGGGKSFSLSAADGNLSMDAVIGTALAPVKYNVNLKDSGGGIFIQKSIFTGTTAGKAKANITATQHFLASSSGGLSLQGVLIGSNGGKAVTLSTKGSVNITGANIYIGSAAHVPSHENVGAVSIIAGTDINLHASGTPSTATGSHVGKLGIAAGVISGGSVNSDRSVLIQAGHDINILGYDIGIRGGAAFGSTGATHKTVTVTANTTLKAVNDVNIRAAASGSVHLDGGSAGAFVGAGAKAKGTYAATADAELNITAGKNLNIGGGKVDVSVGYGDVVASAGKGVTANANTNVSVNLKGNAVSFSGGTIAVGGHDRGFVHGTASGSLAKANATVHADINITATTALSMTGRSLSLEGGDSIGESGQGFASGHSAVATLTATGGLNLTAGAAGVTLAATSGNVHVRGGNEAGSRMSMAASGHGKATATVGAGVKIATPGSINVSAAGYAIFSGGATNGVRASVTATGGKSALTVNSGLSVTAVGLSISANSRVEFNGGGGVGAIESVTARQAGSAVAHNTAGITVALTGAFTVAAGSSVEIRGATAVASSALAFASHAGDKATLVADGSVHIGAKTVQASGSGLLVQGGGGAAAFATAFDNGGAATLTADASVGITAVKGITFGLTQASDSMHISGGDAAALAAHVRTGLLGKAQLTAVSGVNLTTTGAGAAIKLTTNAHSGDIVLKAGSGLAATGSLIRASASAGFGGGVASINATSKVNLKAAGAVTLQAGNASHGGNVLIVGGGSEGTSASVHAIAKLAKAAVNLTGGVSITGTAVTINGGGSNSGGAVVFEGGGSHDAQNAVVLATFGGQATENVTTGVNITTTGALSVTAGSEINISGGHSVGRSAAVIASHSAAQATLNLNDTVNLKAASVTLDEDHQGFVHITGASDLGGGDSVSAAAKGDKAAVNGAGGVTITATTGAITLTAAGTVPSPSHNPSHLGDIGISAGRAVGAGALVDAFAPLASATMKLDATVTLNAKTNFTANASESASLRGGSAAYEGSLFAFGKGAKAAVSATADVKISAASVSVTAGQGLQIAAGDFAGASLEALSNGSAVAAVDASVSFKTTGKITLSATNGALGVRGGNGAFLGANISFHGHSSSVISVSHSGFVPQLPQAAKVGGKDTGTVTAGVTFTAGNDVDLTGGAGVTVQAGDGAQLFVGAARLGSIFLGHSWNGGVATLTGNVGATITAGHDLNLNGGKGSVEVDGMHAFVSGSGSSTRVTNPNANVRGGSSAAVAKVTLLGNVVLTAKHDVTLTAAGTLSTSGAQVAGNVNIIGGSLSNLRADHAAGKVTILGSAAATVHAGSNVILKGIGGSLNVAGTGINASHSGVVLADAHADHGSANVTGHADATLSATHNITMGSANSSLGGAFNVVGGQFVTAVSKGDASIEKAVGTGNATVSAGGSITIKGKGDLNLLGGLFGSASAAASSSAVKLHAANLSAKATVSATGALSLSLKGDGVVAGGDSLGAKTSMGFSTGGFGAVGAASGDVSANIKAANVSITVGGNLLLRGGSGELASAFAAGGGIKATATANAGVNITATGNVLNKTGNVTIKVGTGSTGTASIIGGSAGQVFAVGFGSDNVATATAHSDVTIAAGAALNLTVSGPLKVAGGPGAGASGFVADGESSDLIAHFSASSRASPVPAFKTTATGTLTSKVLMTAGTTLTVNAGKAITILGGSHVGSFAAVDAAAQSSQAAGSDKAALSVDASVAMKAIGKITVAAVAGGVNITTTINSSSALPFVTSLGMGNTASAKLKQSVTLTGGTVSVGTGTRTPGSGSIFTSTAGKLTVDWRVRIGKNLTLTAQSMSLPPVSGSRMTEGGVQIAPSAGATSFGFARPLVSGASPLISLPSSLAPATVGVLLTSNPLNLDLLQSTSLVTHLVPVLAPPAESPPPMTLYDPTVSNGMPESDFGGGCRVLLQRSDGHYQCKAGGQ